MKKFFALALAALMVSSLSTVAFASSSDPDVYLVDDSAFYMENDDGQIVPGYEIDADGKYSYASTLDNGVRVKPGAVIYIPVSGADASNKTAVGKMKIFTEWTVGKPSSNPTIEYKKVFPSFDEETGRAAGTGVYTNLVMLKLPAVSATGSYDLNGTIKLAKNNTAAKNLQSSQYVTLNITVEHQRDDSQSGSYQVNNGAPVIEFDKNDADVDISWGNDDSLAMFEVNVSGQGKLNLAVSTKVNNDLVNKYDTNMNFITFTASPVFNRTGTLYLYAEEDTYLYEVSGSQIKTVSGAEYDEGFGAWVFKTRKLTSYVISDKKLRTGDISSSSSSSSEESSSNVESSSSQVTQPSSSSSYNPVLTKPNPDTGR